jgi:hypothetical protein
VGKGFTLGLGEYRILAHWVGYTNWKRREIFRWVETTDVALLGHPS